MGAQELIIIAVIAIVVLFGGTQVPKIARNIGSAKSEFRKGLKDGEAAESTTTTTTTEKPEDIK